MTYLGFESIINQQRATGLLTGFLRNKKIPHALLFTGIDGVGKRNVALLFAMACNCANNEHQPCGICKSCGKIKAENHPDILCVKPSNLLIKIDQIRSLLNVFALKPYEAHFRVVIISDAQTMNDSAANALLKALEEPPNQTILILTAVQSSDLLPTIVSRCQQIRFNPISQKNISAMLVNEKGIDSDNATLIASMANGSYSKALSMIKPQAFWINLRNWLISAIGMDKPETLPSHPVNELMAFAEKLSKNKQFAMDCLEIINSWLRDLVVYKYRPEKIMHKDMISAIKYASHNISTQSLLLKIDVIHTALQNIRANLNLRLTMESLIIKLATT